MWRIIINGPGYFDTAYDLPQGVTSLGRADENDIVLSGDLVSRRHARLEVRDPTLVFEDLGSRNGSKLNGQPVSGRHELSLGDVVQVGENVLTVQQPKQPEADDTVLHAAQSGEVEIGELKDFGAVLLARDVHESGLIKLLDNVLPFDTDTTAPQPSLSAPIAYESLLLLYAVAEKLATASTLSEFLDPVIDRLLRRINAMTAVVLIKQDGGGMSAAAVRHRKALAAGEVPVSDAIIKEALSKGTALAVADVRDDRRFAARESVMLYGVNQVLCIPLGPRDTPTGVLYLNRSGKGEESLSELLDLCGAVAHLIAAGVERFTRELRAEAASRRALERFYSPGSLQKALGELAGEAPASKLQARQITSLHVSISGFPTVLATVPPERTAVLLGEFYQSMTRLVFSYEGTVDRVAGETLVAVFGAPDPHMDDAMRAVRAALAMQHSWDRAMARFPESERRRLQIGLHTGRALTGLVATQARVEHIALGEAVNVATWLAGTASPGQVLITARTLASLGTRFAVLSTGERQLRPRGEKMPTFEVLEEDAGAHTRPGR